MPVLRDKKSRSMMYATNSNGSECKCMKLMDKPGKMLKE